MIGVHHKEGQPLGDQSRLFASLDLDRHLIAHLYFERRPLGDREQFETAANASSGQDRRDETDFLEAVIDAYGDAARTRQRVLSQRGEHGERQEAMSDRPAEGRRLGRLWIDMNELMILGHVGEGVDPRLINQEPARHARLGSDAGGQICERDGFEGRIVHSGSRKKSAGGGETLPPPSTGMIAPVV